MSSVNLSSDGSLGNRDSSLDDREADHYGPGSGGKKRKVPAFSPATGRLEDEVDKGNYKEKDLESESPTFDHSYKYQRSTKSAAAQACSFRKALFLRRKAALIALYLDAQNVLLAGTEYPDAKQVSLPDAPSFERLLPALDGIGVSEWGPDRPDWRYNGAVSQGSSSISHPARRRTKLDQRRTQRSSRSTNRCNGWVPEGSFEYEQECGASRAARARAEDRNSLHKVVDHLRSIIVAASKLASLPQCIISSERKSQERESARAVVGEKTEVDTRSTPSEYAESVLHTKKAKKKNSRRSRANLGNPHHVANYRPSRILTHHGDPFEPYPHHTSLLFPPSMRLLSTSPSGAPSPLPVGQGQQIKRGGEDDFICCFCEYYLSWGSEQARRRSIRQLRAERRRKEYIRSKAKDVADGRGRFSDEESDAGHDAWCEDEDGHDCCTCGRNVSPTHRLGRSRLKPPESDPPDDQSQRPNDRNSHNKQCDHTCTPYPPYGHSGLVETYINQVRP